MPSEILHAWEEHWNTKTSQLIDEVVAGYRSKLAHVDPNTREELLREMKGLLTAGVSWETLGRLEVKKSLLSLCGAELLETVTPLYAGTKAFEDLAEDTQESILSCSFDVEHSVNSMPAYQMMAVAKEGFPRLFARHQVKP